MEADGAKAWRHRGRCAAEEEERGREGGCEFRHHIRTREWGNWRAGLLQGAAGEVWGKEARGRGGEFALASTISVPLSILVPKIYRLAAVQNLGGLRQTYENRAL